MKNTLILAKKDISHYFHSWMGVFVFAFFYLLAGAFFSLLVTSYAKISMEMPKEAYGALAGLGQTRFIFGSFFFNLSLVLMFLVPVISMRAVSEERKYQTLELLFTYPLSDFEIVAGKFLGLAGIFALLILPTAGYLGLVTWLGGKLDPGPVATCYFGFWLLGNAFLALGLFFSSLTENQIVSALATFSALLLFWMLDWVVHVTDGGWAQFFSALSPLAHYRDFTLGIIDLQNTVYFVFFTLYFLFLTLRSIETRNWKG